VTVGRDVLVVGGGIAGLAAAREILRQGGEPLVLEAAERAGGYVHTESWNGAVLELGPQGFLAERPGVLDAVEELGLDAELLPASDVAKRRYLLHRGRLCALPMSPGQLLGTPLLSPGAKLRLLAEPWAKGPNGAAPESIHAFAARRIGREAAEVLVDAAVTGIFAGDPCALSVDACFPKMTAMEREHGGLFRAMRARKKHGASPFGKRLTSFRGGFEVLVGALCRELGERLRLSSPVSAVTRSGAGWRVSANGVSHEAGTLVLATPAPVTAALLEQAAPGVAGLAREIRAADVAVCGFLLARGAVDHPLDGYGYLVPGGRHPVLGCLFESSVFPGRAPEGRVLLRILAGGARNPAAAAGSPEAIAARALAAVRGPLGIHGEPDDSRVVVHFGAIPQYDLGHPARLAALEREAAAHPGLVPAGASWRGVAVNHLVADARRMAQAALGAASLRG
jgi:oxygen-dependent protoporphyrinogen oxidase